MHGSMNVKNISTWIRSRNCSSRSVGHAKTVITLASRYVHYIQNVENAVKLRTQELNTHVHKWMLLRIGATLKICMQTAKRGHVTQCLSFPLPKDSQGIPSLRNVLYNCIQIPQS